MHQSGEYGAGQRLHSTKPGGSIGTAEKSLIEEQHVKMDVEIEQRAKSLDECYGTRPIYILHIACFLDQMCGNDTVDDTQHATHGLRAANRNRNWKGELNAHWRMDCSGSASSTSKDELSTIRHTPQLGQNPWCLQLKATKCPM